MFDGLENDIHWFVVLKARQLGLSTIVRALIVFWAFMHPGLRVALVFDTDSNKEDAREEIKLFLSRLPASHSIPVTAHPKTHLQLANGSRVAYFVAGVKKSRSSGGLGRSRGINCCGATEMSSWGDIEGLRAFERSLAEDFENRLYIWESTARGFNIFHDLWKEAKADDLVKKAIFIGWWAKEIYSIKRGTALFERYGAADPTEEEQRKIDIVKDRYGFTVTMEQLAWYRHQYDPNRAEDDDAERTGQDIIQQELPWYEEEAFLLSGSQFFPTENLTQAMSEASKFKVSGFNYFMTEEFTATIVEPARLSKHAWLKVWEEPDPYGTYIVGADPAFGASDDCYNHSAQVLRCYADGVDQVAEFCTDEPDTRQFAWVLLHLCGAYNSARFLLELNGPGHAVWTEIRSIRTLITNGYLREPVREHGLTNVIRNIRDYVWSKEDSLNRTPSAFHWETNTKRKVMVFERLRGLFNLNQVRIRSVECLKEMQKVVRDGDSIKGEGTSAYDRVMALSLAVRAWEDMERKRLITEQRTRENEAKRQNFSVVDLQKIFSEGVVGSFFKEKQRDRMVAKRMSRRGSRWSW